MEYSLSLRSTQRAPRSCQQCASRKVRCDKRVPCSTCIKRGEGAACSREVVLIRGQMKVAEDDDQTPTYDELVKENERLRSVTAVRPQHDEVSTEDATAFDLDDHHDQADEGDLLLFSTGVQIATRPSISWNGIILPSRRLSTLLVAHGKAWNSWTHCALDYSRFESQHAEFINLIGNGLQLSKADPFWLALYFSVLAVMCPHMC